MVHLEPLAPREPRRAFATDSADEDASEAALAHLQAQLLKRRVRLAEFLHDYDRVHVGRVTVAQLLRGLTAAGLQCTPAQVDVLVRGTQVMTSDGQVNYVRLCERLDEVFHRSGLEKQPRALAEPARPPPRTVMASMPLAEREEAEQALERARFLVASRRAAPERSFVDCDPLRRGRVTYAQTVGALKTAVGLSSDDAQRVAALFRTVDGDVAYRPLLAEIFPMSQAAGSATLDGGATPVLWSTQRALDAQREVTAAHLASTGEDALAETLAIVSRKVRRLGLRLRDIFREEDALRSNAVHEHHFRSTLGRVGLALSAHELDVLVKHFARSDAPDKVDYERFAATVDATPPAVEYVPPTEDKLQPVRALLDRVTKHVALRNIVIYPYFREMDRLRKSRVSRFQFKRALSMIGVQLTDDELNSIAAIYADHGDIDYVTFCKHVAPSANEAGAHDAAALGQSKLVPVAAGTRAVQAPVDLNDVLLRMQKVVVRRRVRLSEFLRDYDPLRLGVVPVGKFHSAMSTAQIPLTQAEVDAVLARFGDAARPGHVAYLALCDAVDAAEVVKRLETTTIVPDIQGVPRDVFQVDLNNPPETVLRLRDWYRVSELSLAYRDYDKLRAGVVTPSIFLRVLTQCKAPLIPGDQEALVERYTVSPGRVSYETMLDEFERLIAPPARAATADSASSTAALPHHPKVTPAETVENGTDVAVIITGLRKHVVLHSIRLTDFFRDFDRRRSGLVLDSKLRTVLALAMPGYSLGPDAMRALIQHYSVASPENHIQYTRLVDDVERGVVAKGMEKDPLATHSEMRVGRTSVAGRAYSAEARAVTEKLHTEIVRRRINLEPGLVDCDIVHHGKILPTQFRAVLARAQILLTDDEFAHLAKAFGDPRGDIDYVAFLRDTDFL